ncbi:MAG TPA: 1-phosphofructokinase [Symbiobacteriaceae bacterium]
MILCVNLNAAMDRTLVVENLAPGQVHRVREVRAVPGGKGANVAKVVASLGYPVTGTGLAGGPTGTFIRSGLEALGVRTAYLEVEGESRICYALVDPVRGTQTELLEPGPVISPAEWKAFCRLFRSLVEGARVVTLSGSLPRGLEPNAYQELIHLAQAAGALTILDTSGEPLRLGLEARPYMVKPNQAEAEALVGRRFQSPADVALAARELLEGGTAVAVISLGAQGAVLANRAGAWQVVPPPVPAANTVGCGDALVAGFAVGLAQEMPLLEAARLATAAAAAKAERPVPGECDPAEVRRLLPLVEVTPIDI